MNHIKKDILKATISGFLVIISFFIWYIFCLKQNQYDRENTETKYIEIETKKNSIEIVSVWEGVSIVVNGEITQSGSIELK